MKLALRIFLILVMAGVMSQGISMAPAAALHAPINLAGSWRFALDRTDAGVKEQWFARDLKDRIALPGILQAQGYGDQISTATPWVHGLHDHFWYLRDDYQAYAKAGSAKVPFLSQPPRHYLGAAWYQRDVEIPNAWQGRRVVLTLERPRWETTVWLDAAKIGSCNSLVAPHVYDLGIPASGRHRLSVRADNRMILPYRPDAHSVSDSLGSTWNGITGKIELTATSPVWIDDAQVFPDVAKKSALIKVQIGNRTGRPGAVTLSAGSVSTRVSLDDQGGKSELEVPLGKDAQPWDEFAPVLQRLTLQLQGDQIDDRRELVFGLREFRAQGNEFILNGRKTNLRGTHNGGDFPLTGYPPSDAASWRRILRICQDLGIEPHAVSFVVPARSGVYRRGRAGFLFSARVRHVE